MLTHSESSGEPYKAECEVQWGMRYLLLEVSGKQLHTNFVSVKNGLKKIGTEYREPT